MTKTIVAVVAYDRFQNVKNWIRCWNMCKVDAQLIIIHNYPNDQEKESFKTFCDEVGIPIISHVNSGFDIARFEDVCRERLEGFPNDWENLIWCTDDTLPMSKDFVRPFVEGLESADVVCMELCNTQNTKKVVAKRHIRTTGFAIKKALSLKLQFPVSPVISKMDCYLFEHFSPDMTFLDQVERMGLKAVQVTQDVNHSPLWDQGRVRQRHRNSEHRKAFPEIKQSDKKVTFICLIYNSYPAIISSLIMQTHTNWELILIHDGPATNKNIKALVDFHNDPRITFVETPERKMNWGHHWRAWALEMLSHGGLSKQSDYVVITNSDNQYSPVFCEYYLKKLRVNPAAVAAYCSLMCHSYVAWGIIPAKLQVGYIDCGQVMVKREVACDIGWSDVKSHSSDWTYFEQIIKKHGPQSFVMIPGMLFIHN